MATRLPQLTMRVLTSDAQYAAGRLTRLLEAFTPADIRAVAESLRRVSWSPEGGEMTDAERLGVQVAALLEGVAQETEEGLLP